MEEHVPGWRHYPQHGAPLHDIICSFLRGKFVEAQSQRFLVTDETIPPQDLFVIAPLNWDEWQAVLALSLPVIFIDEILKLISVSSPSFRYQGQFTKRKNSS